MAIAPTPTPIPVFAAKESALFGPNNAVLYGVGLDVAVELIVDVRDMFFGSIKLQRETILSVTTYIE
jgi:hypothetical protein